jgi:hypothetical protein
MLGDGRQIPRAQARAESVQEQADIMTSNVYGATAWGLTGDWAFASFMSNWGTMWTNWDVDIPGSSRREEGRNAATRSSRYEVRAPELRDVTNQEQIVVDLAQDHALAEQHAHMDGSVPIASVMAESRNLSPELRAKQISELEEVSAEIGKELLLDLRPETQERSNDEGVISPQGKVTLAIEGGIIDRLLKAKKALQQLAQNNKELPETQIDAANEAVEAYQTHIQMHKPDYARYMSDVQTGKEFFRRYKLITGHNLSPREIAEQRASSGELASQELRVGFEAKDLPDLKEMATDLNQANAEAEKNGNRTDVSLIVNTTKKKSKDGNEAEAMANLVDERVKDPNLRAAVSGLDSAGVEGPSPALLWKVSAKRAFANAKSMKAELAQVTGAAREALVQSLARVRGGDAADARATLAAYEHMDVDAAMAAANAKPASKEIAVGPEGQINERFAGLSIEGVARQTRELIDALRASRAETGDERAMPDQLGYTVHAGEQIRDVDPFQLLEQVEEAVGLGADRIGHGLILGIEPAMLVKMGRLQENQVAAFTERQTAVREHVKAAGVVVESNITSNTEISNLTDEEHPAADMVKDGVRISVSTDDETVLNTTVQNELLRLADAPGIDRVEMAEVILEGFYSRMGARELKDRARLKATFLKALLKDQTPEQATQLATALAHRYHTSVTQGNPTATITRVLDAVFGTGG